MSGMRASGIALAAAALLGWWLAPLPDPVAALVRPRQDAWRLPTLPRQTDQTSTAVLVAGAPYWGRSASAPNVVSTPPADPRWRVAAIYGSGSERGALVQFAAADRPPLRLRVGDKLPSGHTIVEIGEREVCIRIGSKTYRLGVERSESS